MHLVSHLKNCLGIDVHKLVEKYKKVNNKRAVKRIISKKIVFPLIIISITTIFHASFY